MAWEQTLGALGLVLAGALVCRRLRAASPGRARWWQILYAFFRYLYRQEVKRKTAHWPQLFGRQFIVRYEPGTDPELAKMVLATAEEQFPAVKRFLGMQWTQPVLVIVHRDRASLREGFGWGPEETAMGVYWAGVIRILSPADWLGAEDAERMARLFRREGPVAHELAHLLIDYRTGGNYPRWLTEGLAQLAEREVVGFGRDAVAPSAAEPWYPLTELDREFDRLLDQELAYRQSLALVEYLEETFGRPRIWQLLDVLGRGESFARALTQALGIGLRDLETGCACGPNAASARCSRNC